MCTTPRPRPALGVDRLGPRTPLSLSLALATVCLGVIGAAPVSARFPAACGLLGLATGLFVFLPERGGES